MKKQKEFKEKRLKKYRKEVKMGKQRKIKRKQTPYIDGIGMLLLIAGIFMILLKVGNPALTTGLVLCAIGFIRIIYILIKSK